MTMQNTIETPRLILRQLEEGDLQDFYELESDPVVQRYVSGLSGKTITSLAQAETILQVMMRQYTEAGIARLAVVEKASGMFVGLAGVKWHPETINEHWNFYELGYRFLPQAWGKGYATEAGRAALEHCFDTFNPPYLYGFAHPENIASLSVLLKLGFVYTGDFLFDGAPMQWFERKAG